MTCWFTFLCCILHSLSTDCFILLEHKTSKQIPISFLLPTLDVSLVMLRNTGSSTRRHALTQSENSHGPVTCSFSVWMCHEFHLCPLSTDRQTFVQQKKMCTVIWHVSLHSAHTAILTNHVLSLSLLLHLEKLRFNYTIDQLKNDIITNEET